ncbi:MAG: N-acetyltransferase, partial [Methylobacteriaceae bacterium]|nr:N-acetyltransferase [Methylobacteriaceae bacterium]
MRTRSSSKASSLAEVGPDLGALTVEVATGLGSVPAADWDRLATSQPVAGESHNPFVSHAFLTSLEDSGCVGKRTGWGP